MLALSPQSDLILLKGPRLLQGPRPGLLDSWFHAFTCLLVWCKAPVQAEPCRLTWVHSVPSLGQFIPSRVGAFNHERRGSVAVLHIFKKKEPMGKVPFLQALPQHFRIKACSINAKCCLLLHAHVATVSFSASA